MESVTKLDQNDADIICHRQDHLADTLGLPGFGTPKGQTAQLGHALNNMGNLWAKHFCEFLGSCASVLHNIVEEGSGQTDCVQLQLGQESGHLKGMGQIRFSGKPHLTIMDPGRIDVRSFHQAQISFRVVGADAI